MKRNNTIGIVGRIAAPLKLIVDAAEWKRKVYETTLKRSRPSDTEDVYMLQFAGCAAGSEKMLQKITEGVEVLIGGEIRTENVHDPSPEESRVKVYIYAEVIAVNDPPVNDQNEVTICGNICKPPHFRVTRRQTKRGTRIAAASMIIAVKSHGHINYIPCACFGWQAFKASTLAVGDRVEIYGRFQSRDYQRRIKGRQIPYLCTVYEVCAVNIEKDDAAKTEGGKENEGTK